MARARARPVTWLAPDDGSQWFPPVEQALEEPNGLLAAGGDLAPAYNLGRGEGVSVKEIIGAFADVLGRPVPYDVGPRRPGDPDRIVTSAAKAETELGWKADRDLHEMVASAWESWNQATLAGTARLG